MTTIRTSGPTCSRRLALFCILALVVGLLIGAAPSRGAAQSSAYEELQTFSAVLNHIRLNYVDSVTYAEMVRAAIEGAPGQNYGGSTR